jgi:hypothetical protein
MMIDQFLKPNVKRGAIYYAIVGIVMSVLVAIPLLGCLVAPFACVTWLVLPLVIGYFVAQWGSAPSTAMVKTPLAVQSSSPYTTPAIDGAVASAAGALVSGIVGLIIGLLFSGIFAAIGSSGSASDAGGAAFGLAAGAVGGIFGLIIGIIASAIFGAVGGALYVIMSQRKTATPSTPA